MGVWGESVVMVALTVAAVSMGECERMHWAVDNPRLPSCVVHGILHNVWRSFFQKDTPKEFLISSHTIIQNRYK